MFLSAPVLGAGLGQFAWHHFTYVAATGAAAQTYREWLRRELSLGRLTQLTVVTMEFALLVAAIRILNIESESFERVLTLALGGFLVNHYLPAPWRVTFFAALSVASVYLVFGVGDATWLLGLGLLLIGLCHLPAPFWMRAALMLATAGGLAAARAQLVPWLAFPAAAGDAGGVAGTVSLVPTTIWPILGSMFMFRLVAYFYDLKHKASTFSFSRAVGYFFMLPNVCFPLFPVVDYKTLQRSAYNDDPLRIYQTGLKWMMRGLLHLLLYRYVYLKGVIEPAAVVTGLDAARYMIATYLLYLKISGLFHLVVGMLCMYGYALPETHHLYLLSSSFTDFWRRINIYWKEFIQKLVFNPVYFALRKLGDTWAITWATLIAFTATWLLHSYQWFWIRGEFPIVWADVVFWLGLGVVVLVNVHLESRMGRRRFLKNRALTLRDDAIVALKTAGTFVAICFLWTIWSTPNVAELQIIGAALMRSSVADIGIIVAVPLCVGVLGAVLQGRRRHSVATTSEAGAWSPWRFGIQACGVVAVSAACIYVAYRPLILVPISPSMAAAITDIRGRHLNVGDTKRMQRGYYEDLGDVTRFNNELWSILGGQPKDWKVDRLGRGRDDAIEVEFEPSSRGVQKGVLRTINSLGMRDREYTVERPDGAFRIAIVGSSHDTGWGVADGETYENVAEDLLNREISPRTGKKFEIMNFSYEGYKPIQKLAVVERKMLAFRPDVVLYVANLYEYDWIFRSVPYLIRKNLVQEYGFIAEAMKRGKLSAEPGDAPPEEVVVQHKLGPFADVAMSALFRRFRETCEAHGIRPVVVLLETPDEAWAMSPVFDRLRSQAEAAGIKVLDLHGAFDEVSIRTSLLLAPGDTHSNARGHRLLGEKLYSLLVNERIVPFDPSDSLRSKSAGGK